LNAVKEEISDILMTLKHLERENRRHLQSETLLLESGILIETEGHSPHCLPGDPVALSPKLCMNRRIIEAGKDHYSHPVQPPAHYHHAHSLSAISAWLFNTSRDGTLCYEVSMFDII